MTRAMVSHFIQQENRGWDRFTPAILKDIYERGAASVVASGITPASIEESPIFRMRIPPQMTNKFVNRIATNASPDKNASPVVTPSSTCSARTMVINPRGRIHAISSRSSGLTSRQLHRLI